MKLAIAAAAGAAALALATVAIAGEAAHWGYDGEHGPDHWAEIAPEFAMCGAGRMQSPVDLGVPTAEAHVEVIAGYRATPLNLINNGHTVQANFTRGSRLVSSGDAYDLLQVHFHTPAEHAVSGKRYPLVAHFVHRNGAGQLAVLGVFFEQGEANAELAKIVAHAPQAANGAAAASDVMLDPDGIVPHDLKVWRYMGSLTTPPCSEGVNWHVAEQVMTASREQIEALHALMGDNARPVQPLHNRLLIKG
ncbi:carbonic anhydrase [Stakelama tenebrarum]|uniref:carbonic anhydrase n=1 Tax=Stakelama tenebrarum TaxID=2711215 RepID=A0A6G6Y8T0_9SPHN|nr:carbonic anhydrase family protein [Sphingosinithalassobacter tenebrarum]QIG81344.1 hypothetical protein G5C33_17180 [Sphingosinithalassobacter tenebrarum]